MWILDELGKYLSKYINMHLMLYYVHVNVKQFWQIQLHVTQGNILAAILLLILTGFCAHFTGCQLEPQSSLIQNSMSCWLTVLKSASSPHSCGFYLHPNGMGQTIRWIEFSLCPFSRSPLLSPQIPYLWPEPHPFLKGFLL